MEAAPLVPPSGNRGKQARNFFPAIVYACSLSGPSTDDGYDILACFWAQGVIRLNASEFQQQRECWAKHLADSSRRAKKARTTGSGPSGAADVDVYVQWLFSESYTFSPKIHVNKEVFKGSQLQQAVIFFWTRFREQWQYSCFLWLEQQKKVAQREY